MQKLKSNDEANKRIRRILIKNLSDIKHVFSHIHDMGIKIRVSEISRLIIYYILIINACCDISLINCDIHQMRQKHVEGLATNSDAISTDTVEFKINATELEEHIMSGLNMTSKPDIDVVSTAIDSSRTALAMNRGEKFIQ